MKTNTPKSASSPTTALFPRRICEIVKKLRYMLKIIINKAKVYFSLIGKDC